MIGDREFVVVIREAGDVLGVAGPFAEREDAAEFVGEEGWGDLAREVCVLTDPAEWFAD